MPYFSRLLLYQLRLKSAVALLPTWPSVFINCMNISLNLLIHTFTWKAQFSLGQKYSLFLEKSSSFFTIIMLSTSKLHIIRSVISLIDYSYDLALPCLSQIMVFLKFRMPWSIYNVFHTLKLMYYISPEFLVLAHITLQRLFFNVPFKYIFNVTNSKESNYNFYNCIQLIINTINNCKWKQLFI